MTSNVGFRDLQPEEWELIAGGYWTDGFGNAEIVASGSRSSFDWDDWSWAYFDIYAYGDGNGNDSGSGGDPVNPPEADTDKINADVDFTRPLTDAEQDAVVALNTSIAQVTAAINAIGDNEKIPLVDPVTGTVIGDVTGAQLKDLWSKTDFVITEDPANGGPSYGLSYGIPSGAQTTNNNGNPLMEVNINFLVSQSQIVGGMNDYVLHELGHNANDLYSWTVVNGPVLDATERDINERMARAIALAVANDGQISVIQNGEIPLIFNAPPPPPPPPPPSGGGGGGGSGGWDGTREY
jgi:hypothetical protein